MKFSRFLNLILPEASAFLGVFFVVMIVGYSFLYFIDFLPEEPQASANKEDPIDDALVITEETPSKPEPVVETVAVLNDPLPISISIPALNRTVAVLNPTSRSIPDMDKALLDGTVRHPDSADLNDAKGNILLLGHSSYLKNVFNKNFQAFNGVQNLTWGDTITLSSRDYEYTYRVERVYEEKASEIFIPTKGDRAKLTLATCNTFGAKEDRYIVEAILISKKAL